MLFLTQPKGESSGSYVNTWKISTKNTANTPAGTHNNGITEHNENIPTNSHSPTNGTDLLFGQAIPF